MSRNTDPAAAVVQTVRGRDRWCCALCRTMGPLSTQHRRARGMGGSRWPGINRPANLLTLCGTGTTGCHGYVESHPEWARRLGLSVSLHADPARVPVFTWRGWVLLNDDGTEVCDESHESAVSDPWPV